MPRAKRERLVVRTISLPESLAAKLQDLADRTTGSAPGTGNVSALIRQALSIAFDKELRVQP